MPLQNRVDPFGNIFASTSRGTWTGNRGVIHKNKKIVSNYKNKYWITCSLKYKDFQRTVMTEKRWTELFFLDEATAFAAGHRPCGFCRYQDYKKFKQYWLDAYADKFDLPDHSVKSIDRIIHQDRMLPNGEKNTFQALLGDLPDGTILQKMNEAQAYLYYDDHLLSWDAFGYQDIHLPDPNQEVTVLTPKTIVAVLKSGYKCHVHDTAISLLKK